jgi:DNA-binding NarL/FixJ family response regulator
MMDYRNRMTISHPRIVVIEPNDTLREGYRLILDSNKDFEVVSAYSTAFDAIRNIRKDSPNILFLDVDMPDCDGLEVIKKLKKQEPHLQIIVLTYNEELQIVFSAFSAGTSGYITKDSNHLELLNAVHEIMNDGAPMSPKIARMVVGSFQRSPNSPLSSRETEILSSLAMGKTYKITADNLHIGMETVKSHVKNIYSKLEVSSKSEAIELARSQSLI